MRLRTDNFLFQIKEPEYINVEKTDNTNNTLVHVVNNVLLYDFNKTLCITRT